MRKSRFSDEQIAHALRQAENGTPIADIARKLGISWGTAFQLPYCYQKEIGGAFGSASSVYVDE